MNRIVRAILPPIIRRQIRGVLQVVHYRARILAGLIPPLTPPSWLHNVGGGDFHAIGEQQFECLKSISGVKPNDAVIDIGCGTARLARPLTSFLVQGSYDGIDIVKESIEWC